MLAGPGKDLELESTPRFSALLLGKGWLNLMGLVFSQPVMNFDSLYTKGSGFSCLFQEKKYCSSCCKTGQRENFI